MFSPFILIILFQIINTAGKITIKRLKRLANLGLFLYGYYKLENMKEQQKLLMKFSVQAIITRRLP